MQHITTSIGIRAAPQQVWAVLTEFDAYPDWNPFITHLEGAGTEGTKLTAVMQPGERRPSTFRPTITVREEGRVFEWLGSLGFRGIFGGRHRFEMIPTEQGTRLEHSETFTGLLTRPILRMIGEDTRRGFEAMNRALKARAEFEDPGSWLASGD